MGFVNAAGVSVGQADLDTVDFADASVANQLARTVELHARPLLAARLPDDAVLPDGIAHCPALGYRAGERLLGVNIQARAGSHDRRDRMPVIRKGKNGNIEIAACYQLAKVEIRRAIGVLVFIVDDPLGAVAVSLVDITDGNDLNLILCEKVAKVAGALCSGADTTDNKTIARCDSAGLTKRRR